jgi:hypothetical protein
VVVLRPLALCLGIFATLLLQLGCGDDGVQPDKLLSVSLTPTDSTIFVGDAVVYEAVAQYESGTRQPDSVTWTVSNPEVLSLTVEAGGSARVVGLTRGEGYVLCEVEQGIADSAAVEVVQPGDVRWAAEIGGTGATSGPALDRTGRIYVSDWGGLGGLSAFAASGDPLFSVASCRGSLTPSVTADGHVYTNGQMCVARHNTDGSQDWALPLGNFDGGIAVASDGSLVVLHGGGVAELIRVSVDGAVMWRDTLSPDPADQAALASAPAIGANGDAYVAWSKDVFGPAWFSRVSADGTTIWTVPCIGWAHVVSPALVGDRAITTSRAGNLAVYDTSGVLLWARTWDTTVGGVSSPVVDGEGNIYVQSQKTLISYGAAGNLRWSADSLRCTSCGFNVAAPTLLVGGQLLVQCDSSDISGVALCTVDSDDGSLVWRSTFTGVSGSPAVAADGAIYVTTDAELLALWNVVGPLTEGWPTEGGGMGRLRRQQ